MRALLLLTVCLGVVASAAEPEGPSPAHKKDSCTITAGPNDIVKRKGDVVVTAGRVVESVIALKGTVTLKPGARVKSVIAAHGNVVLEPGAEVSESAIALGGTVTVQPGATVHGSQLALDENQLSLTGETGKSLKGDLKLNGESASQLLLGVVLKSLDGCLVEK